jgi:hypothetical protein
VAQKSNKVENNKVNSVEGNDVTVNFNGGTKIVTVMSDTKVVTLVPADRSELKPNVKIFIPAATRTPDGALEANRVTVGKDGIPPPTANWCLIDKTQPHSGARKEYRRGRGSYPGDLKC